MNILTIANLTFREAWRKKLVWVALGLGLAFLFLFATGFHFAVQDIRQNSRAASESPVALNLLINEVSGVLLIMGLFAVNFLIVMMTALTSVATIAGEISSHTIQAIASKPVHRRDIILGKWLGHGLMLVIYVIFMVGGITLVPFIISGYTPPNFWPGLALLVLEGLIVLSLTLFGGTFLSTQANGVLVFMLYGIAFVGSWVEQIGAALESETAVQVGIVASLIMPSEAMWRKVSDLMQPAFVRSIGASPITVFSQPSNAMVVYAVLYMVLMLGGALWQFQRRDL
ncbi:MAG: ABC transporter permease subunit [Anaerolineae bacterium]